MSIRIDGLTRFVNVLNAYANDVPKKTKLAIKKAGVNLQTNAKNDAPIDTGKLRQSISLRVSSDGYEAAVSANASYAPYIEFGTGGSVQVPDGWQEIAAKFKGKGVRQINIKAQPFLIPNFNKEVETLKKELSQILKP